MTLLCKNCSVQHPCYSNESRGILANTRLTRLLSGRAMEDSMHWPDSMHYSKSTRTRTASTQVGPGSESASAISAICIMIEKWVPPAQSIRILSRATRNGPLTPGSRMIFKGSRGCIIPEIDTEPSPSKLQRVSDCIPSPISTNPRRLLVTITDHLSFTVSRLACLLTIHYCLIPNVEQIRLAPGPWNLASRTWTN
jgi:hypothetical protein